MCKIGHLGQSSPGRLPGRAALNDFLRIESGIPRWHDVSFEGTLRTLQERFDRTSTEEGSVMVTTLADVISDLRTSRRAAILEEYCPLPRIVQRLHSEFCIQNYSRVIISVTTRFHLATAQP
jgi:hypothetical protein